MLHSSLRLFTVRGVPVGINWTWLLVFVLLVWSLAAGVFPTDYPGHSDATYLVMAIVASALFFGSILFHELSHTLRSLREGIKVREVTLWLFGGVSSSEEPMPTPGAEFRVIAAGPAATAVLAVTFWTAALLGRAADLPNTVVGIASYLAAINLLLLVFNLVPALPLDGGRLLHAWLWRRSGDRAAATISAAGAGRAFAYVLIGLGLLGLFAGVGLTAIWFVFLGWFLMEAANQEAVAGLVERVVTGLRVRDVMVRDPVSVSAATTIGEFVDGVARRSPHGAYPVTNQRGQLVGLMRLHRAGGIPRPERDHVTVADVMLPISGVPMVGPDDAMSAVLDVLAREPGRALVLEAPSSDTVIGLVSASDLSRVLQNAPPEVAQVPRQRGGFLALLVSLLIVLVGVAALYHPPFVVIEPGASFDIRADITIQGVPTDEPSGPIMLTSVRLRQPSLLGLLAAATRSDREIVALADVAPAGVPADEADLHQHDLFLDSQQMAAAAAASSAGYDATIEGAGAQVVGILESAPAADVLQVDDVIVAVDGVDVGTASDLREAVAGRLAGEPVRLGIERVGRDVEVSTRTVRLPTIAGATGLGIVARTRDLRVVLPFTITFHDRSNIGGPSAGLAYGLAIADMLDPDDLTRSRAIAATGTIAADGAVGEVGGVREKAIAAEDAGAQLLLVPAGEVSDARSTDLAVRGVTTLDEALQLLQGV
jgi:PDZ domain-containing secreted protein/Zn-dependent protease/CBS domain-containing protein